MYGKNASGKSNLGLAIFDITTHLTDKNVTPGVYDYYLNTDGETDFTEFHYVFKLEAGEVDYVYRKSDLKNLLYEKISINDNMIMSYDYVKQTGDFEGISKLMPSLNYEFQDNSVSILRYVVNNTPSDSVAPLKQLMRFVNNMLWFRSLDENRYIGYKTESSDFTKFIFENEALTQFQELLNKAGVNEKLTAIKDPDGQQRLYFNKKSLIPFFKAASNGTKALYTLFYWLTEAKDVSFLFIGLFP
ncbi:SMC domain-containing protein [Clostridium sp. DL-VIII]|uniref:AAA family ATPase n=1 Tax=Clostridium sp. DL-VIII TaxID=641107 RepID=UPI00023AFFED|nr:AAA family ATPase [Clostridium sp. DL-VIII]EHJ00384.1 SMC domain-containing protein [Clostridium sp. DL-VIII]